MTLPTESTLSPQYNPLSPTELPLQAAPEPIPQPAPEPASPQPQGPPKPNPFAEWRVELHDGGCKTVLYSGSQENACDFFAKRSAQKLYNGSLQLFAPNRGMPVNQTVSMGYRSVVTIPDDYQGGDKPPVISVNRPNVEEIMSYFAKGGRVVSDKTDPVRADSDPAPACACSAPVAPAPSRPAPAATVDESQAALLRDLALVDAATANLELVQAVLIKHRKALIERLSTSQNAPSLIAEAIASLEKLT